RRRRSIRFRRRWGPARLRHPPRPTLARLGVPRCSASSWRRPSSPWAPASAAARSAIRNRTRSRSSLSRTSEQGLLGEAQMSDKTDSARPVDPGLTSLVMLLRLQGVAADAGQIRHRLGTDKIGAPEMLRCAKDYGLKARACRTDWRRLARTPLPGIATLRDGGFLLVGKVSDDKVLVQSPLEARPARIARAPF